MGGLLVATVTFTLIVIVLLAVLVAVTVLPVFVALQMADARRFSNARWGAISLVTVALGLSVAYLLHKHDASRVLVALPLVLTWAAPGALWLLETQQTSIGGRPGLHE
jgi:hypothetical protein